MSSYVEAENSVVSIVTRLRAEQPRNLIPLPTGF